MSNDNDQVEMRGHSYDGITEYDNPLPTWWLWTFFLTIIFSFIYYVHYTVGGGPTLSDELKVAMAEIQKGKEQVPVAIESEEKLVEIMKKDGFLELGATAFTAKCAACHGNELQGLIGPNLTDKYWIHGKGTRTDIIKVVRDGVPDKGMPPWGQTMSSEEAYAVTAYIYSKLGSNPANAKAPQGNLVE